MNLANCVTAIDYRIQCTTKEIECNQERQFLKKLLVNAEC